MNELLVVIILILLVAVFLRLDIVFYLVYVLFGVLALSRWWTSRGLRAIEVERRFPDHAFLGEAVTVEVQLRNRSLLPIPWLHAREAVPLALHSPSSVRRVISLRPRESVHIRYDLSCRRRGYYDVGPLQLTNGDLFGFADAEHSTAPVDHLIVYPEIIPLARLGFPSKSPFGTIRAHQPIFEDPARTAGMRDYRPGDSLRRIHWKASARQEGLLVKTYQPAISLQTLLLVNLNSAEYSRQTRMSGPEWAVAVAASLASHLAGARQAVGLATNGHDPLSPSTIQDAGATEPPTLPPRSGRQSLMKLLEILARIEARETESFCHWLGRATLPLGWGDTVAAISPNGDEDTCRAMHQLCRMGYNVVLLIVDPQTNITALRQRARRLGFAAFQVARRPDMDTWRRQAASAGIEPARG